MENFILVLGLALILLVAASKGYLNPLAWMRASPKAPDFGPVAPAAGQLDSKTLGLLFAQAVRREAEQEIAGQIAVKAAQEIHTTFTAPFAPPAVAPQAPASPPPPA